MWKNILHSDIKIFSSFGFYAYNTYIPLHRTSSTNVQVTGTLLRTTEKQQRKEKHITPKQIKKTKYNPPPPKKNPIPRQPPTPNSIGKTNKIKPKLQLYKWNNALHHVTWIHDQFHKSRLINTPPDYLLNVHGEAKNS